MNALKKVRLAVVAVCVVLIGVVTAVGILYDSTALVKNMTDTIFSENQLYEREHVEQGIVFLYGPILTICGILNLILFRKKAIVSGILLTAAVLLLILRAYVVATNLFSVFCGIYVLATVIVCIIDTFRIYKSERTLRTQKR